MSRKMDRRQFLQSTAGLGLGLAGVSSVGTATAAAEKASGSGGKLAADGKVFGVGKSQEPAWLPKPKGPRVVVVGGGWSGLTVAAYLRRQKPGFDVVLIDRKASFFSCPLSNLWLADQVDMEFLSHSYLDAARQHGYLYLNASVVDLDRETRKVYTDQGYIGYDYLVLSPGIDYDYGRIGVDDPEAEFALRMNYPAGFMNASEYLAIKRKLHEFQGGTFALTVPKGNYRCMAAPYERACMAAAIFKKRGIKAKVLLLDMNQDIRIKQDGFHRAFSEVYPDIIHYEPGAEISEVNLEAKTLDTDFDSYEFDDAVIYPPIRASRLIEQLGLENPKSLQKEGNADRFKYHLPDDEHVYIAGDARPQPFSKSANTAYSEARYLADVIVAHAEGREIDWRSPQTMCFSGVTIDPLQAMSIVAFYKYHKADDRFGFDRVYMNEEWSQKGGQAAIAWGEGMYRDLFGKGK
ncbi:MAG: FAD-dependent oxidoreductase [bacterium]